MSNLSFANFNSPIHTSSSFEGAPSSPDNNIPSPPPSPVHPPLLLPIFPLPPQVFILGEVPPFNWSEDEEEDSEELWLRAEEEAEGAEYNAFMASSFSQVLNPAPQSPLTRRIQTPLIALTQGMMKARRRRKKKRVLRR